MLHLSVGTVIAIGLILFLYFKKIMKKKVFIIILSALVLAFFILSMVVIAFRSSRKVQLFDNNTSFYMTKTEVMLLNGSPNEKIYNSGMTLYYYNDEYEGYQTETEYTFRKHLFIERLDSVECNIQVGDVDKAYALMNSIYEKYEKLYGDIGNCNKYEISEDSPGEYYAFVNSNLHGCFGGIVNTSISYKGGILSVHVYYS